MTINSNIIIKIEKPAFGGYGLGKDQGKVILVDYAVPGDIVNIDIYNNYANYSIAQIKEIIEPSPLREKAKCPLFSICGGCTYQNVGYETELTFKKEMIIEQLKRVAGIEETGIPVIEIITGERYKYRSHTRFNTGSFKKGFYKKGSNDIVEFPSDGCCILSDELNNYIADLEVSEEEKEVRVAMDCNGRTHINPNDREKVIIEEQEKNIIFRRDINSFFQANRFLRASMIDKVIEFAELKPDGEFLDVCSGCGFFSLPLALISKKGYGFDIDRNSISFALKNASINKINNVKFYNIPESEIRPDLYNPQTVIIDPPRSGISKRGRKTLNAINPRSIVYVSCNPSTFARDLRDFVKNNYRLKRLVFIDMFPCTHHIEIISQIVKSDVSV